ncbi:MAG: hypothetical protein K0R84_724 [Clostridia bacterium]|nr:hypothetical protein [Clostridia bacterium]
MTIYAVRKISKHFLNKRGQGMIEYLFIIILIALVVIVSLTPVSTALTNKFAEFTAVLGGNN